MSRRKKKEPIIEVIAYLSTTGPLWETKKREKNQERYIREYGRANLSYIKEEEDFLADVALNSQVWMSHSDTIKSFSLVVYFFLI